MLYGQDEERQEQMVTEQKVVSFGFNANVVERLQDYLDDGWRVVTMNVAACGAGGHGGFELGGYAVAVLERERGEDLKAI